MNRSLARTIAAAGAVAALGTAAAALPVSASAAPEQTGGKLFIYTDPAAPETTRVTIEGVFEMEEPDAVGFLNNIYTGERPGGMEYSLFADDSGTGDSPIVNRWIAGNGSFDGYHLIATPEGIHHIYIFYLPTEDLNEDDGVDELYAQATFVDADGGRRTQITNVISGEL